MLRKDETDQFTQETITCPLPAAGQISISTFGRFRSKGNFDWDNDSSNVSFHFIREGQGYFETDGKRYRATRGDLYAFFPGQLIHYWDTPDAPWSYTWCYIHGEAEALLKTIGITRDNPLIQARHHDTLWRTLDQIETTLFDQPHTPHYGTAALWQLICALERPEDHKRAPNLAQQAKHIIDDWTPGTPTVDEVTHLLGVQRSTLFRAWKSAYNGSPKAYIDENRLKKATRLLEREEDSIKSIAFRCGYRDQLYFSRAFKKRFGMSPKAWRDQRTSP